MLDSRTAALFAGPPAWLDWIASIAYASSFVFAAGLVVATIARGGTSRGILRDVVTAVVSVSALGFLGEGVVYGSSWPDVLPELFEQPGQPAVPAFRVALVLTVVTVQSPYLTRPVRRLGRWAIGASVVSTLFLGFSGLTGVVAAGCAGIAVVAAVRLTFGSPEGLPPEGRLRDALARLGVDVASLEYDTSQTGAVGRARAIDGEGRSLEVKIYGRDAADAQRAEQLWRRAWYRRTGPATAPGRLEQVQHESLGLLLAERAGISTPTLHTAGVDEGGDAILVSVDTGHRPLAECPPESLHEAELAAIWAMVGRLRSERLAHGAIGPWTLQIGEGAPSLRDFEDFSLSASDARLEADRVATLATTAGLVGNERAVDAMIDATGKTGAENMLPYLQDSALTRPAARWLKDRDVDVEDLRALVVERCGTEPPELAKLRRVSLGGVVMVLVAIIAANAIVSQIAEIGFDVFVDELRTASVGWLVAGFVIRLGSYATGWLSMQAMVTEPVPFGPTTVLQSAKTFVGLVVPSTLGQIAMDVRFLQKMGTPTAVAVAQGPLIGFVGFLVEVTLLLLTVGSMGDAVDSDELLTVDVGGLVLVAVGVTAVGIAIVLAVRPLRDRVVPPIVEAITAVKGVILSPSRLGRVVGGETLERIASSLTLACVISAYGASLPFAVIVFVTVGTKLLAGLAPVPGGIGVAEALLTGLLSAAGLPAEEAFAIAISYRLIGSYLPPVLGFFSLQWLKRNRFL